MTKEEIQSAAINKFLNGDYYESAFEAGIKWYTDILMKKKLNEIVTEICETNKNLCND